MSKFNSDMDYACDRLRDRIAMSILLDEQVIAALARAVAILREANDSGALDLEQVIRTHRVGILKRRAVLGAAGIDV